MMDERWDEPGDTGSYGNEAFEETEEIEEVEETEEIGEGQAPAGRVKVGTAAIARRTVTLAVASESTNDADLSSVSAEPTWTAAPPLLIPIRDRRYVFGRAASFAEFAAQSSRYGTLLRNRYAETRLPSRQQAAMILYPDTLYVLAVVTEEDPDTLAVLPVVARLLEGCRRFDLRIVRDDEAMALLSVLLPEVDPVAVSEEWDLPQFLCFDEDFELVAQWGPRPATIEDPLERWLASHPEYERLAEDESPQAQESYAALVEELIYEMRVWYNSGAARGCLDEWRDLLLGILSPEDQALLENETA